jgi:hypothetical protein
MEEQIGELVGFLVNSKPEVRSLVLGARVRLEGHFRYESPLMQF